MDIRMRDMNVLRNLLPSVNSDFPLAFRKSKEGEKSLRVEIGGPNFTYRFLISDLRVPESLVKYMGMVLGHGSQIVDFGAFYRIVEMAGSLSYATGRMGIKAVEGGLEI